MSQYNKILVAVDLTDECRKVVESATQIASGDDDSLHLVHVVEPISFAYGGDIPLDIASIQEQILEQAKLHLNKFSNELDIDKSHQHVLVGRPAIEMRTLAEEVSADLIVVGSHGRHGIALLLGSTANGILHGAPCDVLAVRV